MMIDRSSTLRCKRTKPTKKPRHHSDLESLPKDLIVTEILTRVAASSHVDILNAKLISKSFNELAQDNRLFRHVCIEEIMCPWRRRTKKLAFLDRCRENGNPRALFRQGVIDYFFEMKPDSGHELLKKASENGSLEATYVLCIILLCKDEEFKEEGMKLLIDKVRKTSSDSLKECRKNVEKIMSRHWPSPIEGNYTKLCTDARHVLRKRRGWHTVDSEDDDDDLHCQACLCDLEIQIFRRNILGVR